MQRPRTTAASSDDTNSAISRDLPPPASPTTVTRSQRSSAAARLHACRSVASSCDRPTNADSWTRSGASRTLRSRYAPTGSDLPLSSRGSTSSVPTASRTSATDFGERGSHLDGRAAGAQRIVLVHLRNAEDGHDRVTDELPHRGSVRLEDA